VLRSSWEPSWCRQVGWLRIYAGILRFYQSVIEWYLSSKLGRVLRSSNENLKQIFDDAVKDIEDQIAELYREASIGSTAMLAMVNGNVSMLEAELRRRRQNYQRIDPSAAHRMRNMLQATSIENKPLKSAIESAKLNKVTVEAIQPQPTTNNFANVANVANVSIKRTETRSIIPNLSTFINGEEGRALFSSGSIWLVEDEVQLKLRGWMGEVSESQILWISSPLDSRVAMTASKAAALAHGLSCLASRDANYLLLLASDQPRTVSKGMTLEQQGLMGFSTA
jgi:regulator of replication initiation timing